MIVLDHLIRMADNHPFLAFCEIWTIGCVAGVIYRVLKQLLRTFRVLCLGWPPKHLDADGDWKRKEES